MSSYPLSHQVGITKAAIQKALEYGTTEEDVLNFIHGDIDTIYNTLPQASNCQPWETSGKRYVQIEEVRFVTRHFLRNGIRPTNQNALILGGTEPALACIPWAMSNLAKSFHVYENKIALHRLAINKKRKEKRRIEGLLSSGQQIELEMIFGNILSVERQEFGIIDLDFCNNRIREEVSRVRILNLIDSVSPKSGPFVLRTTLHVGRKGNSKKDVEEHIDQFEEEIRSGDNELYQPYKIRAHDRSPYQSSLPMISLIWILERRENWIQK